MDALSQAQLEDLGLQPPLQEVLNFQAKDIIELHLALIQHTYPNQAPQESITLMGNRTTFNQWEVAESYYSSNFTKEFKNTKTKLELAQ